MPLSKMHMRLRPNPKDSSQGRLHNHSQQQQQQQQQQHETETEPFDVNVAQDESFFPATFDNNNININDNSSIVSDSFSTLSMSSNYRHHNTGPFMPPSFNGNQTLSSSLSGNQNQNNNFNNNNTQHRTMLPSPQLSYDVPKPVLVKDTHYKPKTTGAVGILMVGLNGTIATTALAAIVAHRMQIQWYSNTNNNNREPQPHTATWKGCLTQQQPKTNTTTNTTTAASPLSFAEHVKGLADASLAAVGGWDIRSIKPGDALWQAQTLDYDLVRQIKDEMNKIKVFRGVVANNNNNTHSDTHILTRDEIPTDSEALKCLRADIRYFKWRNGVVGHTTVVWTPTMSSSSSSSHHHNHTNAHVANMLARQVRTAQDLLQVIEMTQQKRGGPLPPIILYATAALLEGSSFLQLPLSRVTNKKTQVNNNVAVHCPGLYDLAHRQLGVYCLMASPNMPMDSFRAVGNPIPTATTEAFQMCGWNTHVNVYSRQPTRRPTTVSTTVTSRTTTPVANGTTGPSQFDHDASRDETDPLDELQHHDSHVMEYVTSGFLDQTQRITMTTVSSGTQNSDTSRALWMAPVILDGAVWCDYFSQCSWPDDKVAKALSYVVGTTEETSSFYQQRRDLEEQVRAAHMAKYGNKEAQSSVKKRKKRVRIRPDEKATEWAIPHDARIICAGLACVDMQLHHATGGGGDGGESIETFEGERSIGGGSVSMACKTLARLCHGAPLDEGYMQVTPPVVHSVIPLCKIGPDGTGDKLIEILQKSGEACRNVECRYIKAAQHKDPTARTALAVLPIYEDGRRGCFFDAASNATFSARELVEMMELLSSGTTGPSLDTSNMSAEDIESYQADLDQMTPVYGSFLFGYPHLLPNMQGESLMQILLEARSRMIDGGIVAVDLNGVPEGTFQHTDGLRSVIDLKNDRVLGPALEHIDILHMNIDELCLLTGCSITGTPDTRREDDFAIGNAVNLFLLCGVGIVAVTRGKDGSFVACNDEDRFRRSSALPSSWVDCSAKVGSVLLPTGTLINSNGAGDSFTAGLLVAAMLRHTGMTVPTNEEEVTGERTASADNNAMNKQSVGTAGEPPKTPSPSKSASPKQKMTPYALYMQENYVTLKSQLKDDKKAIFSRCHEMWENETDDMKALYERKAEEENEEEDDGPKLNVMTDDMEALDTSYIESIETPRNMYMTNRSLNLESAVQFASFVAAYHVNVSTRDRLHIDVGQLLDRAMVLPTTLEEI